jgi:hypothetical protein
VEEVLALVPEELEVKDGAMNLVILPVVLVVFL